MTSAARLGPHVARLTESDQVVPLVGFLGCSEFPEWSDVIDGETVPDVHAAVSADSTLFLNYYEPDALPVSPSVCRRTTDPVRGLLTGLELSAVRVPALSGAVQPSKLRTADPVGLSVEGLATCPTRQRHRCHELPVGFSAQDRRLRVLARWPPYLVHRCRSVNSCASLGAEASATPLPVARKNGNRRPTRFARANQSLDRRHAISLRRPSGRTRTTTHISPDQLDLFGGAA